MMKIVLFTCFLFLIGLLVYGNNPVSQQTSADRTERFRTMSKAAEECGLAEPFRGVTTDGNVVPDLFHTFKEGALGMAA